MATPRSIPPLIPGPAPAEAEERGSRVMRFGAAVSAVVLSSAIATLPAAVRVSRAVATSGGASAWMALLAVAFFPMAFATVVLRHAVGAVRLFDARSVAGGVLAAVVWGATMFAVLAALGAGLRATTHHHGLAGVTFALTGAVAALLVALVSVRVAALIREASAVVRWLALAALLILLAACGLLFMRALGQSPAAVTLTVDLVAFALAAGFGAGVFPRRTRPFAPLALAGPPLAAVVLVVGFATLGSSAPLRSALGEEAPVLAAVAGLVSEVERGAPEPPH